MSARADLLELQTALVDTLAGGRALHAPTLPAVLAGVDPERVALMARLTQAKRLGKIGRTLHATFAVLGSELVALAEDFAREHPLRSARGYPNAMQFYRFVARRRPGPPFVRDLALAELAVARAAQPRTTDAGPAGHVARARVASLIRLDHDVQPLLRGDDPATAAVVARPIRLAVAPGPDGEPRVFELDPAVYGWVRRLRGWQPYDAGDGDALLASLAAAGLVVVPG